MGGAGEERRFLFSTWEGERNKGKGGGKSLLERTTRSAFRLALV